MYRAQEGPEWVGVAQKDFPEEKRLVSLDIEGHRVVELVYENMDSGADPLGTKPACGLLAA